MGIFDRFRGAGLQRPSAPEPASDDDQAIARYRYMLRTAPPETIEQAHAEAFAQLSLSQRRRVLDELSRDIPPAERAAAERAADNPSELARVATRAEIRQPGVMERVFGALGTSPAASGSGIGGLFAGSFLASMAGTVLGSMIAQHFFASHPPTAFFDGVPLGHDPSLLQTSDGFSDAFDGGDDFGAGLDGGDTFDV